MTNLRHFKNLKLDNVKNKRDSIKHLCNKVVHITQFYHHEKFYCCTVNACIVIWFLKFTYMTNLLHLQTLKLDNLKKLKDSIWHLCNKVIHITQFYHQEKFLLLYWKRLYSYMVSKIHLYEEFIGFPNFEAP